MEDLNNILSSGIVPNLFPDDELAPIYDGVRAAAIKAGVPETGPELWAYFIRTVRKNLHIVLAMSPIGDSFRNRCRMYPAFVSCTTVDFFFPWPAAALKEVAMKFLESVEVKDEAYKPKLATMFSMAHEDTANAANECYSNGVEIFTLLLRVIWSWLKDIAQLLEEKREELAVRRDRLSWGYSKIS